MVMWMVMRERCGAGSWVAGMGAAALLALTGCGGEADVEGESIDAFAQALCTGVKVSIDPTKTLPPNSMALLTASNATCAEGEVAEYRFMYKRDGDPAPYAEFRGWSTEPTATFDNTGLPSGKYTLQVRARNVGSTVTQNSAAKVVINSGEVCSSVTLKAAPKSPQLPGKTIGLTAHATCTAGTPEFQYFVRGADTAFMPLGTWTEGGTDWDTSGLDVGKYTLRVDTRRIGNPSGFESQHSMAFMLADTCQALVVTFSPSNSQPAGTLVNVNARANCVGGATPEFRYDYRMSGTSPWSLLQQWSSAPVAPWDTTGLAAGFYQVRVQTRAPGMTSAQATKSVGFDVTAP